MPSASPPKSCRNRWNEHRWMLLAAGWACGKKGKVEAGLVDHSLGVDPELLPLLINQSVESGQGAFPSLN